MQYKMEHTIFIHIRQSYSYSTKNEVPSMDNISKYCISLEIIATSKTNFSIQIVSYPAQYNVIHNKVLD